MSRPFRRFGEHPAIAEVLADRADQRVGLFVVDEIGWFGDPLVSADFVGVGVEFVKEADQTQPECISRRCRQPDGLGERARPR